jgi:hypothetical protein
MFGFDGEVTGFQRVLTRIANNDDSGKLTHKEVRAYARCLLPLVSQFNINSKMEAEIKLLLVALSASGLPHYDRAFLASKILSLLSEHTNSQLETVGEF